MLILANIYFWWQEGNGHQIQIIQQSIVWMVFVTEVLLMLSPRLTNGIHGVVQRFNLARNIAAIDYTRIISYFRSKANIGKNQS
jgi:heme/copper-type cytochrome/quinol oxidase subunit 1